MAATKGKRRAPSPPRVQHPKQAAGERRFPRWLFYAAAAGPWLVAIAVLAVWLPSRGSDSPTAPTSAAASLPDTPDYHSLLVDARDPRHVWLGTHQGLHESTDGGRSWSVAGLTGEDAMNLARTKGSNTVWAAGHLMFAKSTDGGVTWADVEAEGLPSLDIHGFAADPRNPRHVYAAVAGQGLYRSVDSGKTFSLLSREVGAGVMALAVAPDGRILAGDMEQGLLVSKDRGVTWRQVLAEGLMGLAINPSSPQRVLATGQRGIWLSTNGGSSWRVAHPVFDGAGPVAWSASAPKTAYAVGFDRRLFKTTDGGAAWRPVS